ncbi:hypothetical protein B0O99DRAFT_127737 [Bisporella sp. PMI_857]|nr:hypothetical protein B0O99DRAFT_127737 [Bisporella sp. PMI_857]
MDNRIYQHVAPPSPSTIPFYPPYGQALPRQKLEPACSAAPVDQSAPIPRQILSKDHWEDLRPLIQRLYIDENKTFRAITEILRESHNFVPTCALLPVPSVFLYI